jgi:hypothetical protein
MIALHDILRAGTVKRFHIVNTTRVQTLAEHQWGVAILACEIAGRLGWDDAAVARLAALCIVHDAGETRTGDVPTPTKTRLREATGSLADEVFAQFDPVATTDIPPWIKITLKCADYLESMIFLMEHKVGRHADAVMDDIMTHGFRFFDLAGESGVVAKQIWSEIQNAAYEI